MADQDSQDTRTSPDSLLDPIERQVVDIFVDGVRVLGLPRSIGEIYGLLFITPSPLSLDDLVVKLGISKGSASQGLRMLKSLGAIREAEGIIDRRTHFEPAVELKRLVGGFIREQVRPHIESGRSKVKRLEEAIPSVGQDKQEFVKERVERLDQWMRRSRQVLPLLQKILGQ
jgi:DNA-binding transcriptional regulator GbsR (MarR family)